tara:strand:+ start:295 stop:519 length:225 start_codon:yes stop_codon:yes gene_type:complete
MKRLLGVKEMRDLLHSEADIYDIVDIINRKAMTYAFKATMGVIEKEANAASRKLKQRIEVTKKLKRPAKTFIKI